MRNPYSPDRQTTDATHAAAMIVAPLLIGSIALLAAYMVITTKEEKEAERPLSKTEKRKARVYLLSALVPHKPKHARSKAANQEPA